MPLYSVLSFSVFSFEFTVSNKLNFCCHFTALPCWARLHNSEKKNSIKTKPCFCLLKSSDLQWKMQWIFHLNHGKTWLQDSVSAILYPGSDFDPVRTCFGDGFMPKSVHMCQWRSHCRLFEERLDKNSVKSAKKHHHFVRIFSSFYFSKASFELLKYVWELQTFINITCRIADKLWVTFV